MALGPLLKGRETRLTDGFPVSGLVLFQKLRQVQFCRGSIIEGFIHLFMCVFKELITFGYSSAPKYAAV